MSIHDDNEKLRRAASSIAVDNENLKIKNRQLHQRIDDMTKAYGRTIARTPRPLLGLLTLSLELVRLGIEKALSSTPDVVNVNVSKVDVKAQDPDRFAAKLADAANKVAEQRDIFCSKRMEVRFTSAAGNDLDEWGKIVNVKRLSGEPDAKYRERIVAALTAPPPATDAEVGAAVRTTRTITNAVAPQPMPTKNGYAPTWPMVIAYCQNKTNAPASVLADMRVRDEDGLRKYGVQLQPHNGRNTRVDYYQELLDATVYRANILREVLGEVDLGGRLVMDQPFNMLIQLLYQAKGEIELPRFQNADGTKIPRSFA